MPNRRRAKVITEYEQYLLPIEERPLCKYCKRPLKPFFYFVNSTIINHELINRQVFKGEYGFEGNNLFCTMRHGYSYALAINKVQR